MIATKTYLEFIADAIKSDGWKVADIANKKALDLKKITLAQYSKAARLIVDAYLTNS